MEITNIFLKKSQISHVHKSDVRRRRSQKLINEMSARVCRPRACVRSATRPPELALIIPLLHGRVLIRGENKYRLTRLSFDFRRRETRPRAGVDDGQRSCIFNPPPPHHPGRGCFSIIGIRRVSKCGSLGCVSALGTKMSACGVARSNPESVQ